jgi:exopolysaccharide production protein ExoQ
MLTLQRLAEKIFVVISLLLSTSALIPILLENKDGSTATQDPYTPLLFIGIYGITSLLLIAQHKTFLRVAQKDILIWLLIGIALASVLWTVAPDITPRRSFLLLGTTLFGIYLAMRYSFREQLELLAWVFSIIMILSIVFAIALPSYGLMTGQEGGVHAGAWRGVMSHKNILGRLMVMSSIVFLCLGISHSTSNWKNRWFPWTGYLFSLLLIVLSTSKTSLIVFLILTISVPLYRTWRRDFTQLVPIAIALLLVGGGTTILLLDNLAFIANAVGRDLTLTGRTDIWNAMLEMIWERPLLGYGFNGFWRDWDSEITASLWRTLQWECPYGHNGFMDLLAELGISGLAVFLFSYITTYFRAISWLRMSKTVEGIWPLIYLTFLLIYNISESTLLATNSIFWILYVSTIFSILIQSERLKLYGYSKINYDKL